MRKWANFVLMQSILCIDKNIKDSKILPFTHKGSIHAWRMIEDEELQLMISKIVRSGWNSSWIIDSSWRSGGFKSISIFKHSIMISQNDDEIKILRRCKCLLNQLLLAFYGSEKAKSSSTFQSKTSSAFIYLLLMALNINFFDR